MSTLFAGPFVGEFGWELMEWQGYIREISKDFDKTIVSSRSSSEFLYRDFYDEFVPYEPKGWSAGYTCYGGKYKKGLHEKYNPDKIIYIDEEAEGRHFFKNIKNDYIRYGDDGQKEGGFDIIFHARMIKNGDKIKNSRNWDTSNWNGLFKKLSSEGFKIASIGLKEHSCHIEGTKNLLNLDLHSLSKILNKSKVIVGPSSGPMHFASLCGCPQIVWGSSNLEKRYKQDWNPFGIDCDLIHSQDWNPSCLNIFEKIKEFLNK